jgi:hypothetical protein
MYLDLHLTERTELRTHSRLDDTGRPFAEIQWDFHGPLAAAAGRCLHLGGAGDLRLQPAADDRGRWLTRTSTIDLAASTHTGPCPHQDFFRSK